jgi:transcriptional regulator, propionate catabolism operon regulatory protein
VGATEPTPVNVRMIAATHRDLTEQVARGLFRLDLYYRLNILRLDVPPLRERPGDIAPIAQALHRQLCQRLSLDVAQTQPLMVALMAQAVGHDWPGNVRELENIIERVMAFGGVRDAGAGGGKEMSLEQCHTLVRQVAPELGGAAAHSPAWPVGTDVAPKAGHPLKARQVEAEREEILRVLAACSGDRAEASQRLGISRTTLWRKLKAGA